jgi:acyl transferase domain-containing protein
MWIAKPEVQQMQAQQTALSSLQQSQQVIADQLGTITNYEQEIAALKTSLSAMQEAQTARDQDLAELKSQVQSLVKEPPKHRNGLRGAHRKCANQPLSHVLVRRLQRYANRSSIIFWPSFSDV